MPIQGDSNVSFHQAKVSFESMWLVDIDGNELLVPIQQILALIGNNNIVEGAPQPATGYATNDLTILSVDLARQVDMENAIIGGVQIVFFDSRWQADPTIPGSIWGVDITTTETASGGIFAQTGGGANEIINGDNIQVGNKVYVWRTTITGGSADGDVLLGANDTEALQNLFDAINLTGTPGTQYALATTLNADLYASAVTATSISVEAKFVGTFGDGLDTLSAIVSTNYAWGGLVTSGGVNPTITDITAQIVATVPGVEVPNVLAVPSNRMFILTDNNPVVNFLALRPGTSSNDIRCTQSNISLLSWATQNTSGGTNSPTAGVKGTQRVGVVVFSGGVGPIEAIFLAIEDDLWEMTKNNSNLGPFVWTNI